MHLIDTLFGQSKDLNTLQMVNRAIVVFLITLVLLRLSGRRSFGMRSPVDNIIVILLGAVLSRAVVGASPFVPVVGSSLAIVVLHRLIAWASIRSPRISRLIEGGHIAVFENGKPIRENMSRALICEEDLEKALRSKAATEDFGKIVRMYMEHNGEISVIKKDN